LSRLPEVISEAADEPELFVRLVNLLLVGIPAADAAALVEVGRSAAHGDSGRRGSGEDAVRVLHWDRRLAAGGDFQPSERLIREAVRSGQSVLHVWEADDEPAARAFTLAESCDWAFCTPVPGAACQGWAIYVTGRFRGASTQPGSADSAIALNQGELRDDLKFTELVAQILASLRRERLLQRNQAVLSQFFSPAVLGTLADDPEKLLAPQEADVSVLFCDLRGFSREAEKLAGDLVELLERVSEALGVMTHHILEHGGVVGDFQGDAALAFWGWPIGQPDAVGMACQAALGIRDHFETVAAELDNPLADFRAGIGIATGRAVAGRIGTQDQVKVTVFGPVVNLASRLEGMTKILHAPILVDEATAEAVRQHVPADVARCRRVARVKPYGLDTPLMVSELLPPASVPPSRERQRAGAAGVVLTDADLAHYEAALDAFLASRWPEAFELLHRVPPEDRVKDFLTVFIAQHNRTPPKNWDGVIPLLSKS
jgi:adenylate cyclase